MRKNLEVKGKEIYLNGEKTQILSGAIHYFRVVPEYWEDRLKKLKNCGLNAVETYVPWNLHEPEEGKFCFDGICDMERFFQTADALGLYVIVRPSPYICAEWEGGGLPYWLLCYKDLKPRCSNELYFEKIKSYYNELMPRIKKHLFKNGGPIIAVQVENEYGSFGNDKEYISRLYRLMLSYELDTFFFTADGTEKYMLNGGLTDGVFATANFGSDPEGNFEALDARRPNQPHFCMEYWCGWFDHWGEKPHKRDAEDIVAPLKRMQERGEHFNIYMFHGGTNFGFMNGANYADTYQPTVTSYDYGAFLTENGEYTEQYRLLKNELSRYREDPDLPCKPIPLRSYGEIRLTESARLFDNLERISALAEDTVPRSFEELRHPYGFVLYRTKVAADTTAERLKLNKVRDRVWVYADGKPLGIIDRMGISNDEIWLGGNENEVTLDLLAENLGRINYGPKLLDKKGIDFPVMIGQQQQFGYKMYPIDFERISELEFKEGAVSDGTPVFLYGELYADECADTFLDMSGFTKGCVFINGFNLGRYWNIGPTLDLYIPAPLIKKGKNEIVVFETERFERDYITANDYRVKREEDK